MICDDLASVLSDSSLKAHVKPDAFISGVIFGVSASPEIPMPEAWMPWVLDGPHEIPLNNEDVDKLAGGLIAQLQWQLAAMRNEKTLLPSQCKFEHNESSKVMLETWLQGVLFAHQNLENVWQSAWDQASKDEDAARLTRCLKCFSVLANSELTLSQLSQQKREELANNLPTLAKQLNGLLVDYVNLAGELADNLPGQFELYTDLNKLKKH
jgi:uncharacterized protein